MEGRRIFGWDIDIDVNKRVPVCAGLGGGSSDAAAVLRALNMLFNEKMTADELRVLADRLGSDVPYCVTFGTARAEGRGNIITSLNDLPTCDIVICKPSFAISTPSLFRELDERGITEHPDTAAVEAAVGCGDLPGVARNMSNVFESVLGARGDMVKSIKAIMLEHRALGAVMSGTGSAVFALYDNPQNAKSAAEVLRQSWDEIFLCKSITGIEL